MTFGFNRNGAMIGYLQHDLSIGTPMSPYYIDQYILMSRFYKKQNV